MAFIQDYFSIKDLENLSGIKAHTIRIWEQRYHLLKPVRSETNIRIYPLNELRKLLNISVLKNSNYKISKIAQLSDAEINTALASFRFDQAQFFQVKINEIIIAMLELDKFKFNEVYNECIRNYTYSKIFLSLFIPLFDRIGLMWQSNVIQPAHEYFISNLVRQKLYATIDHETFPLEKNNDELFVILLPLNEIHDIGALFINYQLIENQKNVIYLGPNISLDSLKILKEIPREKTTYIVHGTISPTEEQVASFIKKFTRILQPSDRLILAGRKASLIRKAKNIPGNFYFMERLDELKKFL